MESPHRLGDRLVRLGVARSAALVTLASMATSMALCLAIYVLTGTIDEPRWDMFVLPLAVPLVVAPLVSIGLVRTLVRIDALQQELGREVEERRAAERELDRLAHHDPLSGLVNRRGLARDAGRLVGRAAASGRGVVVVALDLDGLKQVNDERGHAQGDQAIVDAADALRAAAGTGAVVGRVGGDEFVVVLAEDGPAAAVGERLRAALAEVELTAGAGATTLRAGEEAEAAWSRADALLLEAKRSGRDRVRVA